MARNAALWLFCLLLLGATGCTWTDTYQEYPPSIRIGDGANGGHQHAHAHPGQPSLAE
jgi:hypothetical protein